MIYNLFTQIAMERTRRRDRSGEEERKQKDGRGRKEGVPIAKRDQAGSREQEEEKDQIRRG